MSSKTINRTEKPDSTENPNNITPDDTFNRVKKGLLVPFRINRNTVIFTKPENCTDEYRKDYLDRMGKVFLNS